MQRATQGGAMRAWDHTRGVYLWDWFAPHYNCPRMQRLGRLGDGGKWLCDLHTLQPREDTAWAESGQHEGAKPPCTMYSYGVRDDVSFEVEFARRTGCHVHTHDPSVGGLPGYARHNKLLDFSKVALVPSSTVGGSTRATDSGSSFLLGESLYRSMARNGHHYIDVLKVDVEGAEWDVFRDLLLDEDAVLPFGQLLIELHLPLKRGGSAVRPIPVPFPRLLELPGRAAGVWSSCLWVLNAVCLHSARNAR